MKPTDIDRLLAAIDDCIAGCMGCGGEVPAGGLSDVFCGEDCQRVALERMADVPGLDLGPAVQALMDRLPGKQRVLLTFQA